MNTFLTLDSSRYKGQQIFQITVPQGMVFAIMVDYQIVLACQKSDLVALIDREEAREPGLDAQEQFKLIAQKLPAERDVVLFARAGKINPKDLVVPPKVMTALSLTSAFAAGWLLKSDEEVDEESILIPRTPADLVPLKGAIDEATKLLTADLRARTGERVAVKAEFTPQEGLLRGKLRLVGLTALVNELAELIKKQMGQ
ncbi:MAG: hypothetical protein HY815_06125 [Candidatus Riflebacteria bacterium]|nr:hypothetical protein [Candidatus Riflebacteria bacterium]